jgi:hypothetical protein
MQTGNLRSLVLQVLHIMLRLDAVMKLKLVDSL